MAEHRDQTPWTDAELDSALATLHAGVEPDDRVLASIRADLVARAAVQVEPPAAAPRRRPRLRLAAFAAVAVAAAAALIVTLALPGDGPGGATAEASVALKRAARFVEDEPLAPGQFRYIRTHSWVMGGLDSQPPVAVLQESVREIWQPARFQDEWLERFGPTGRRRLLVGTSEQARAAGLLDPLPKQPTVWRAPCRGYGAAKPCAGARGGWDFPTPQWIASLPRDPGALYERLRKDALADGHGEAHILATASDALESGLLPADVRAALYEALSRVPGLRVTAGTANLDGARGIALGIDDGATRQEIVIDDASGRFIGERRVQAETGPGGLKPGTVIESSAVTSAVADRQGEAPPR